MEIKQERRAFFVYQSILLVVVCGVQAVMLNEKQLLELGVMQTIFYGLGVLRVLALIFCAVILYRLLKRRKWYMVALFIQSLGACWGLNQHYLFLNAVLNPAVLRPRWFWQYYTSLGIALAYLLIYQTIKKKRKNPAIEEASKEI